MVARGRKPAGDRAMTPAERMRASRERRLYPTGYGADGYGGKQISLMLSGKAAMELSDLIIAYSDKSQKEIIELAITTLCQTLQHDVTLGQH